MGQCNRSVSCTTVGHTACVKLGPKPMRSSVHPVRCLCMFCFSFPYIFQGALVVVAVRNLHIWNFEQHPAVLGRDCEQPQVLSTPCTHCPLHLV